MGSAFACAVVFGPGGAIVLVRQSKKSKEKDKRWSFPGGGVEEGESEKDAAIRETEEESGLWIIEKGIYENRHEDPAAYEKEKERRLKLIDAFDKGGGHVFVGFLAWVESYAALRDGILDETEANFYTIEEALKMMPHKHLFKPAHWQIFLRIIEKLDEDPNFLPEFPYRDAVLAAVRKVIGEDAPVPAATPANAA